MNNNVERILFFFHSIKISYFNSNALFIELSKSVGHDKLSAHLTLTDFDLVCDVILVANNF